MREYQKPYIEEEDIEIEDICAMSNKGTADAFEDEQDVDDIFI